MSITGLPLILLHKVRDGPTGYDYETVQLFGRTPGRRA